MEQDKAACDGVTRRAFVTTAGGAAVGPLFAPAGVTHAQQKRRYAIVGTGVRGIGMWGRPIAQQYANDVEFVGLSDVNPIRLETAKRSIGLSCPTFTNFDEMLDKQLPGSRAGAMSCLTGIAARKSCDEGKPIRIADLVNLT